MRLLKLHLSQFKGIQSFSFSPDGDSATIYGANATGKTTVADAITWLLFDKDTEDRSPAKFGIKTLDDNGEPVRGAEHTVEGVFALEDDSTITLRKIYKEKWTTKRGSSKSTLESHKTDHYWDDEPISQNEYKERIDNIMPEETFKMLTLPNYFAEQMHWKDRRKILTTLCGEISDEEIVEGNSDLAGYLDMLGGKSQEAKDKILREKRRKLNDELNSIPDRIDENNQKITDPDQSEGEAKESVEILQTNLEGKRETLSEVQSGGGVAELNVKVQEIEAEKAEFVNNHQKEVEESLSDARKKVSDLQDRHDEVSSDVRDARRVYQNREADAESARKVVKDIESKLEAERKRAPEPKPDVSDEPEVCPYCEQEIPEKEDGNNHEDHYQNYLKEFNAEKAETVKQLNMELSKSKAKLAEAEDELKEAEKKGLNLKGRLNQVEEALQKAKNALQAKKDEAPSAKDEPAYAELEKKQKALLDKVNSAKADRKEQIDEVKEKISALEDEIEGHKKVIRQHEFNREIRKRNEELREMLKKHGKELEDVEASLMLIEDFNRARADFITDKVNDLFAIVNWRLFKEQVNGGMTEVCDPVVSGVPYSEGLNNARRVQAGMDIINTLSRHYGNEAPVFVDNRESVTNLPETGLQVISLVVSAHDKKLRVESAEELQKAVA